MKDKLTPEAFSEHLAKLIAHWWVTTDEISSGMEASRYAKSGMLSGSLSLVMHAIMKTRDFNLDDIARGVSAFIFNLKKVLLPDEGWEEDAIDAFFVELEKIWEAAKKIERPTTEELLEVKMKIAKSIIESKETKH